MPIISSTRFNYLNIGSNDNGYFVYRIPGEPIFTGTYTQCLIVLGAVSNGSSIPEAIRLATR